MSDKNQQKIFVRDDFLCSYCGDEFPIKKLEIDHIIALNNLGSNSIDNLTTSCISCNRKKYDLMLKDFIEKYELDEESILKRLVSQGVSNTPSEISQGVSEGAKDKDKDKAIDKDIKPKND